MLNSPFFLSDAVVHALGWTLVHSLWQGAAAALILWLSLPRLGTARRRYWAAYFALLAVLAAALVSFTWIYAPSAAVAEATGGLPANDTLPGVLTASFSEAPVSFWQTATGWLETYYPALVTIWLLGFVFFCLQLAGGLYFVQRLRRQQNRPLEAPWLEKLQALANRMRFSRRVTLVESALVQTPMALGFLKPLILLPVGLVNQISTAEVEAILAHELAHIARRDWLFNLLQAFIEAIFYFHPAVWWISAAIRAERENCCDDTAVALTGNRLAYAKTLVRLQDLAKSAKTPALALGLEGAPTLLRRRPLLLERIKRILHQPQPSTSLMEKMIATAILLALITLWSVRANTPPALAAALNEIAETPIAWFAGGPQPGPAYQAPADTIKPQRHQKIVQEDDKQRVEMELQDGKITRLNVDGKDIPEAEFSQYHALTEELLRDATPPPAPPFPPMPPSPPAGWEMPAPALAPMPPLGPASRISTDKDEQGNTIIRLERNGKPMEITIKEGDVWVDGKKVEKGESLELPGDNPFFYWNGDNGQAFRLDGKHFFFPGADVELPELPELAEMPEAPEAPEAPEFYRPDGGHFLFKGPEGQVWEVPAPNISDAEIKRIQEETLRHLKLQQKDIEKALKEREKEWKQQRKHLDKQEKEQRKALEEAKEELERARMAQSDALLRAREEARAAQRQQLQAYRERRGAESFSTVLKNSMVGEKLIADPNNFSIELSGKELRINGQKQPDNVHQRYLELYQQKTGKVMGKKDSIRVEEEN